MTPITSLLPNPNTKLFTHWMPWFGQSNHRNVGYDSTDTQTIAGQCTAMKALGITGVIPDWYGFDVSTQSRTNLATLRMLRQCEAFGLKFICCIDGGALKGYEATATQRMTALINYVMSTFATSGVYERVNGRPVVLFFGDSAYTIDWNAVRAGVITEDPLFIFRNKSGFGHAQSNGAFSWLSTAHDANDPASLAYLYDFYKNRDATKLTFGSIYPGFNDEDPNKQGQSVWGGPARFIDRRNGVTFLDSIAALPADVEYVQIVTWNDYEEGSDIERTFGQFADKLIGR